ncbi:hypothetical protein [Anabaena sp. PCC 7108]|uniref:hypothetical protein n=1 Tax=Anabaena sp. PCC 7108 TaxID=163908 RepID=UPI000374DD0D|nr:hypothetical protein [Anabaena sp. PCC 7108]
MTLRLKKAAYNIITFSYPGDLSNRVVYCRLKKRKEDGTIPLIEGQVILSETTPIKSTGYFEMDFSTSLDLQLLIGEAFIDFKIINLSEPNKPSYSNITPVIIETTLKV